METNKTTIGGPRFCKVCGIELPSDSKNDKCEAHRRKSIAKTLKRIAVGTGTVVVGAVLWIKGKK